MEPKNHPANEPMHQSNQSNQPTNEPMKPYTPPAILHEIELETRAGSLLSIPGDPRGLPEN